MGAMPMSALVHFQTIRVPTIGSLHSNHLYLAYSSSMEMCALHASKQLQCIGLRLHQQVTGNQPATTMTITNTHVLRRFNSSKPYTSLPETCWKSPFPKQSQSSSFPL